MELSCNLCSTATLPSGKEYPVGLPIEQDLKPALDQVWTCWNPTTNPRLSSPYRRPSHYFRFNIMLAEESNG
jgi:hypothetical protein